MKIKETMTRNPEIVRSGDSVKKAAELMKQINVGVLPVFDGEGPIGILSDRDIAIRLVAEGKDPVNTKAGDIMSKNIVSCTEDTDVIEAAKLMTQKKVRRLLVKDAQGKLSGIVSLGDLADVLGKEMSGEVIRKVSQPSQPKR
jgi:CBS domain-containing protein